MRMKFQELKIEIIIQARAKLELRTETTEKDALDVIEILQYTFEDKITNCQSLSTKNVTNGRVSKLI